MPSESERSKKKVQQEGEMHTKTLSHLSSTQSRGFLLKLGRIFPRGDDTHVLIAWEMYLVPKTKRRSKKTRLNSIL